MYRKLSIASTAALAAFLIPSLAPSANATPLTFGFIPIGSAVLDTGNIKTSTVQMTYPSAIVNIPDVAYGINIFDLVSLSGPFQLVTGAISLTISVDTWNFLLDYATRGAFIPTGSGIGSFSMEYSGPGVTVSQSCDQSIQGGPVNCSDTLLKEIPIPEPSSIALFLGAFLAAGIAAFAAGFRGPSRSTA